MLRRCRLNVDALYTRRGEYHYTHGYSVIALLALAVGVLPSVPGFLANVKLVSAGRIPLALLACYNYAWFVGFAMAFALYLALRMMSSRQAARRGSETA